MIILQSNIGYAYALARPKYYKLSKKHEKSWILNPWEYMLDGLVVSWREGILALFNTGKIKLAHFEYYICNGLNCDSIENWYAGGIQRFGVAKKFLVWSSYTKPLWDDFNMVFSRGFLI